MGVSLPAVDAASLPGWLYVLTGIVAAMVLVVALSRWRPLLLTRILLWLPFRLFYRLSVFGRDKVPATGPVLFVCNHVSYIDAFLVLLAQRRPIRFVVWAPFTRIPGLRWLMRLAHVIPIDGSGGPRSIIKSLQSASKALSRGEAVCIFAEGGITRTGFLLPFHRGFEQILKRTPAPIVPVCLDHVWGSIFSYQGSKFIWKWPQKLPYPVTVGFGDALPPTASASQVRQAIQKLSADTAMERAGHRLPVHRQFLRMAARHPFRTALIDAANENTVYNCAKTLTGARLLSQKLRPILGDEQFVGIWLPPVAAGAIANIAVALLGKTSVNLNYTSSGDIVTKCVDQARDAGYPMRHVLTSRAFTHKVKFEVEGLELIYLEDFRKEVSTWQRLRTYLGVILLPAWILDRLYGLTGHGPDDLCTVIFSSGSTGIPKGVMLSHRNLAANTESVIQAIDPGPRDRLVGTLPLFHSFGYTITLWLPLQTGASLVYYPDPRQAKEIGELCRTLRCTIYVTTPTLLRFALRRCDPADFKTLRILMLGAEKMPPGLAKEFEKKFGILPLEGYGCTELSPVAAANVPDWEEDGVRQIGNKTGTIGQPLPGIAAKIVDPDTFVPLPNGTAGMLMIYGGNVMMGYLGKPDLTREVIRDGWYVTGDQAKFDEDGFITITDRLSRFSKIAGEMVPHGRIEDELHQLLGTTERLCVVTAVPDEKRGERLIVLHVPLNGTEVPGLLKQLNERGLPNLWIPDERDFHQIENIPVLGSGKVDLQRCKEIAREHVNPR